MQYESRDLVGSEYANYTCNIHRLMAIVCWTICPILAALWWVCYP